MGVESVLYTFGKFRKAHKSPNSAHPMSALRIRLGGKVKYFGLWVEKSYIGEFDKQPKVSDIKAALRLLYLSSFLAFLFFGSSFVFAVFKCVE